jgi:hypothetical protein
MTETPRSDQLDVLARVVERLDALGIRYMLTGSLAYSLYVEPRMTRDIDIVIEVEPDSAARLAESLGPSFYCDSNAARRAASHRSLFNAIDEQRLVKVDFVVRKDEDFRRAEFDRRRRVRLDDLDVWIVSAEDLVLSKLLWGRTSDSALQAKDIRALVTRGPVLNWEYLTHWARALQVHETLEELRGD